jgi:membrane protein DedA with SNARE-associated domain
LIEFPQSEISTWGGGVVFLNVLLTRLGVPIPAVPVLLFAGSAIASGTLSFWYVLPAAVLGALIGDGIWFTAGRLYGQRLINALSRLSMSAGAHVRTARSLFERFGAPIVSVSKFIPGLGIATPPLMGTTRVDPRIFLAWDLLGIRKAAQPVRTRSQGARRNGDRPGAGRVASLFRVPLHPALAL